MSDDEVDAITRQWGEYLAWCKSNGFSPIEEPEQIAAGAINLLHRLAREKREAERERDNLAGLLTIAAAAAGKMNSMQERGSCFPVAELGWLMELRPIFHEMQVAKQMPAYVDFGSAERIKASLRAMNGDTNDT